MIRNNMKVHYNFLHLTLNINVEVDIVMAEMVCTTEATLCFYFHVS